MVNFHVTDEPICTDVILNGTRSVKLLRDVYQLFQNCPQQLKVDEIFSCLLLTMNLEKIARQFISLKQEQQYPGIFYIYNK
jgi:hypothetical protein